MGSHRKSFMIGDSMDSHFIDGHPILPSHLLLPRWIELSFGPTRTRRSEKASEQKSSTRNKSFTSMMFKKTITLATFAHGRHGPLAYVLDPSSSTTKMSVCFPFVPCWSFFPPDGPRVAYL